MTKKRNSLKVQLANFITYHPWLKVLALLLSILIWLYVNSELNKYYY
ncbi:MAG: hypothetical protein ABIG46_04380 [Candidatus Omnitrophota bacterium]